MTQHTPEELPETGDFPPFPPPPDELGGLADFPGWPAADGAPPGVEMPGGMPQSPLSPLAEGFPDWPAGAASPALGMQEWPETGTPRGEAPGGVESLQAGLSAALDAAAADFPGWPESPAPPELLGAAEWPAGGGDISPLGEGYGQQEAGRGEAPVLGDIHGTLVKILDALTAGGRGSPGATGFRHFDPQGPLPWEGGSRASRLPEEMESYPAGSPSVDVTSLSGARWAGGWGYGSRPATGRAVDLAEPTRRFLERG